MANALTWRDVLRVFWPHLAFLAAFAALFTSDAFGAPRLLTLPLAVVAVGVFPLSAYRHLRETHSRRAALAVVAGFVVRGTFLVGLAVCVGFTTLFVVGGFSDGVFHDEDVVLLVVCWSVLALIWLGSRYIPMWRRRRAADV